MNKEILLTDLDAVLNNLNEVWLARYNEDYQDNLTLEDFKEWGIHKIVKPECGNRVFKYLTLPGFFGSNNLSPIKHAQEVTKRLSQYFDIRVATAYNPITCVDKCEFIDTYYPWIGSKNVIFINDKSILKGKYLIDDGPHNHDNFSGNSIIMDYAYSRDTHPDKIHASDWLEVEKIIMEDMKS